MCGRLNVTDSPGTRALCEQLDISLWPAEGMRLSRFVRATERVSVVFENAAGQREMHNAIWWLLLDKQQSDQGSRFVPSKYTSFNTRYDKLNTPRSAGYHAFRQQRCVIPARGFGETLVVGSNKRYHDMQVGEHDQLAMGGLYRVWHGQDAYGKPVTDYSCSVVTLAPHDKLADIHTKASPLMLSPEDGSLQRWLDCKVTDPEALSELLVPRLRHRLSAHPVDKPSTYQPTGAAFALLAD